MFWLFSAASGCVWWLLAAHIATDGRMGHEVWIGMIAAPFIGIAAGLAAKRVHHFRFFRRVVYSLGSLYATAALFALVMGVMTWWTGSDDPRPAMNAAGLIATLIRFEAAILIGLSLGFVLLLWPLSYLNHLLIWGWLDEVRRRSKFSI